MDTVQQAEMMGKIFDAMNMFLGTVGLVTLALGAIGVINIMLVAVSERTREIGLRKALGATNRSILVQFFLEGILLTFLSGLIGMGLAGALMALLGTQPGPEGFDPPKLVPASAILAICQLDAGGRGCRTISRAQGRDAATGGSTPSGVDARLRTRCIKTMLRDLLQEAYGAMRHNRRRTALTMLGMAWGIATVVMLLAYGNGFGQACANIFANFGTKLMIVVPGRTLDAGWRPEGRGADTLYPRRRGHAHHQHSSNHSHHTRGVQAGQHSVRDAGRSPSTLPAIIPTCFPSARSNSAQGRFYNAEDEMQHARVAVIGSEAKEKLFSGRNALGERIRIDGLSVEVVGIVSPKMQAGDDNINRVIYVPFTTMSDIKDTHYLDSIWFNYETPAYEGLEQSVRSVMAIEHKFNPDRPPRHVGV